MRALVPVPDLSDGLVPWGVATSMTSFEVSSVICKPITPLTSPSSIYNLKIPVPPSNRNLPPPCRRRVRQNPFLIANPSNAARILPPFQHLPSVFVNPAAQWGIHIPDSFHTALGERFRLTPK